MSVCVPVTLRRHSAQCRVSRNPTHGGEPLRAGETFGRPELLGVVVTLERRRSLWDGHPPDLRSGVDVHVRRDIGRIVERPAPDEAHLPRAVFAEERDLTLRAAEDPLDAAVVSWHADRLRRSRDFLQAVGLDEQVEDEGAAGLALTVQAVAAVNDHRFRRQPVPNRAARAAALTWHAHATV